MVVQYLVSRYAYTGLRAPDLTVDITNTSMPALTYTSMGLSAALTQVAGAAQREAGDVARQAAGVVLLQRRNARVKALASA